MLYYALIHSCLTYGLIVRGSSLKYIIRKIILQKKSIRCIHNANYLEHSQPLFSRSNIILKLEDLYKHETAKFMFNCIHHVLSFPLIEFFSFNDDNDHNTRQHLFPHTEAKTTSVADKCIIHTGSRTWCQFSKDVRLRNSKTQLIRKLKK